MQSFRSAAVLQSHSRTEARIVVVMPNTDARPITNPNPSLAQIWFYWALAFDVKVPAPLREKLMNGVENFSASLAGLSEEERQELKDATAEYASRATFPTMVSISGLWELIDAQ